MAAELWTGCFFSRESSRTCESLLQCLLGNTRRIELCSAFYLETHTEGLLRPRRHFARTGYLMS